MKTPNQGANEKSKVGKANSQKKKQKSKNLKRWIWDIQTKAKVNEIFSRKLEMAQLLQF
jgi:hypothetical protein